MPFTILIASRSPRPKFECGAFLFLIQQKNGN